MNIKNINLEKSFTLTIINGIELYYSYGTLVAVNGVRTNKKYSTTTSKHLNKHHFDSGKRMSPEELEEYKNQLLKD